MFAINHIAEPSLFPPVAPPHPQYAIVPQTIEESLAAYIHQSHGVQSYTTASATFVRIQLFQNFLTSALPYDTVRSRTPPRIDPLSEQDIRLASRRSRQYRAIHAGWRVSARRLTKVEQRECLLAAECLNIIDPLGWSDDRAEVSTVVASESGVTIGKLPLDLVSSAGFQITARPVINTVPLTVTTLPSRLTQVFRRPALHARKPLTSTYTPTRSPLHPEWISPRRALPSVSYKSVSPTDGVSARACGSPFMVPRKPPSTPGPRSPTPDRMSSPSVSPGWTHVIAK